jgi:CDGSH-type Zn-finger protein
LRKFVIDIFSQKKFNFSITNFLHIIKRRRNLKDKNTKLIKIVKNGPFLVYGGIPLLKLIISADNLGYPYEWIKKEEYPLQEEYALCRCGQSEKKPFCDGKHEETGFQGIDTTSRVSYLEGAKVTEGPELILTDNPSLCSHAGFCTRAGGIVNLVRRSEAPKARDVAIQEAGNCSSGSLVVLDRKTGNPIEPDFEPSIAVTEEPGRGVSGPLWVRGMIPIKSADGTIYEIRNRVTLCRCGESFNIPFCDGTHIEIGFNDGDESI